MEMSFDLVESGDDEDSEESKHEEEAPGNHIVIGNDFHNVVDSES